MGGGIRSNLVSMIVLAGTACGLAAVVGCDSATKAESDPVNNGLAGMKPGGLDADAGVDPDPAPGSRQADIDRLLRSSDRLFGELFEVTDKGGDGGDPVEDAPEPVQIVDATEAESTEVIEETPIAEAEPTPEERAQELSVQLEAALRESADDPFVLAVRLAGLLAGEENAAARLSGLIDRLPEDQRAVARAVADIVSRAGSDPDALTEALVAQADTLDEARPVRIRTLAMCSRVEGFGRYTELASTTFVAGSPMRMIIYTEVDHFDRVPMGRSVGRGGSGSLSQPDREPGYEVRLSQELQLYHESDGLLAWRRPDEVTAYRTRSRPRDFFVVNQIELPRTLTVGAYRLKVIMRDLGDRSVDERIVPIRVVADAALAAREYTPKIGG